jgi:fido (protein-threonine AMPylation protein)
MIQNGLIKKTGNRRSSKYQIEQNINIQQAPSCFSPKSLPAVALVRRPLYERPPVAYSHEWFDAYKPNHSYYIPENIRTQLYKEGKRSRKEDPAGTYAHQIFNRLLIDLSYNSSRLEGNTYSLLDTKRLILEGKDVRGKLDEEKIMILNHKEAIRYLVDRASFISPSLETFFSLHFLLSDGLVETQYAGKIRDHGVRIGGSTYVPFENQNILQSQLIQIAKKASLIEDPYEQSFFLLVHLTYLQPFIDVNKRTARLSCNIPLIKQNLVPLSFNDVEREDYIAAVLAIYELQDVQPLIDIYAFSYLRTCSLYDITIKALGFDEVRVRYRAQRRAIVREIILSKLHGLPLSNYITSQTYQQIPPEDQQSFLEDIEEDLKYIDESRISGLGVTPAELTLWQNGRTS